MVELLEKQEAIKSRVIGALIYPVFVICLAIAALMIMLMFVFPAFKDMFNNLGDKLPIYTKICLQLGEFLKAYWGYNPTFYSIYCWWRVLCIKT
ncbi:MAG: hypothetical protein L6V95_12200 [Candidatus Melainabacteria bacterium]|nr:MAG: hypothetical protein L6V95_12200 [Candidatus Melainabacteria bacterium]